MTCNLIVIPVVKEMSLQWRKWILWRWERGISPLIPHQALSFSTQMPCMSVDKLHWNALNQSFYLSKGTVSRSNTSPMIRKALWLTLVATLACCLAAAYSHSMTYSNIGQPYFVKGQIACTRTLRMITAEYKLK